MDNPNPPRESLPRPASTTGSIEAAVIASRETPMPTPGIARLRLCEQPEPKVLRAVVRRLCDVNAALVDAFAGLCRGDRRWPLFVHGPAGTGKTYAALALSDMVQRARYTTLEWACDDTIAGHDVSPRRAEPGEDHCLLILDEIGERTKGGDLHYAVLKGMLDFQEYYCGHIGLYLSNVAPGRLCELFDDRIVSRLTCGTVVKLTGPDRRHVR